MEPLETDHEKEKIERLRRAMYSRNVSEKLGERPRHEMEEPRPLVGETWHIEEPEAPRSLVAPRAISYARTGLWWLLAASAIFFVCAILFFIYYFTLGAGASPASPANISISVSGPPSIAGGEATELQIVVTNRNPVPLELAELVITFPEGTRSVTDLSSDLPSLRQPLGTIEPGGRRQGTVSAVFAGSSGDEANVSVELEYRVQGSNAIFTATSDYRTTFSSSPVTVSVQGKNETVSGQPVEFTVTLASNSNTPVKDVLLSAAFPFGFTFSTADPAPKSPGLWELGDFLPGQRKQIVLRGALSGESNDERVFRFTAGTREAGANRITTAFSESSHPMKISTAFLTLGVSVNKTTGANAVVAPGENVNVVVSWENNLPVAITDAVIVARLTGLNIDGATVISQDGFYRSSDNAVLWNKTTTNGAFAKIEPGAKGTVSFAFRMPSSEVLAALRDPSLTVTVNAAGKRLSESGVPENLQSTASQKVAVASDLSVSAQGLYYANPFQSQGPLPPKAGTETTYAIVFTVTNTTNKIENAKLQAILPPYVRWVGIYSPSSEKLVYNQSDGSVVWDIGTIDAGEGLGGKPPRQFAIAIGFTPSTSQIGQEPVLLQNIVLTGKDAATGGAVNKTVKNVTTNIIGDPGFTATQATVVR